MEASMLSNIVIGVVGFFLVSLSSVVAWFAVKSYADIDKNMERHSKSITDLAEKHSDSISKLADSVKDLAGIIRSVQSEFSLRHSGMEQIQKDHHEEIEMLRKRTHDIGNWVQKIVLQGQIKNGWEFKSEFSLSGVDIK